MDADQILESLEGNRSGLTTNLTVASETVCREVRLDSRILSAAVKWFLEIVTNPAEADRLRVFRIENLDVLNMLGLKPPRIFPLLVGRNQ